MKKFYWFFLVILFLSACTTKNTEQTQNQETVNYAIKTESTDTKSLMMGAAPGATDGYKSLTYTKYNLPLPIDIYTIIENQTSNFMLLNSSKNILKYEETYMKSFNLGIYTADLAYTVKFHSSDYFSEYFDIVNKLAKDLEINAITTEMINKISFNRDNPDSLKIIAEDMYWSICKQMEGNKQINVMPFVVVGGWIESLYILSQTQFVPEIQKIVYYEVLSQEETLKNITQYLYDVMTQSDAYILNRNIQKIIKQLDELKVIYDNIIPDQQGEITNEQYTKIKLKIEEIRNKYASAELN